MADLFAPVQAFPVGTTDRSTTQKFPLGAKGYDEDGNEYTYLKAEGVIAVGAPISVTGGISEATSSSDAKGFEAIAYPAAFADEEYGFALTQGRGLALVPSGVALGDSLTAGNGALSGTLTSGVKFATVQEAPVLLSGSTQLKYVYLH